MGLEPTTVLAAPVFKTGSSSSRMTSVVQVAGAGIEPTPRRSERPVLPLDHPALFVSSRHVVQSKSSGRRIRTFTSCFKGRWPAISRSPNNQECPAGVEPASPGWKPGTFPARPRAHNQGGRRGSRTLKAVKLDCFRDSCHRQLACPSFRIFD